MGMSKKIDIKMTKISRKNSMPFHGTYLVKWKLPSIFRNQFLFLHSRIFMNIYCITGYQDKECRSVRVKYSY